MLHAPPTQHQLQGRLGKGVFSWAHCHLKQNQDYASKEEGNWSWVDNKQCLPKTKGELWLLSFISTSTHWAPTRCQTLCHVLWHLAFNSGYPEFKEWSFFTGVSYQNECLAVHRVLFVPNHQAALSLEKVISSNLSDILGQIVKHQLTYSRYEPSQRKTFEF